MIRQNRTPIVFLDTETTGLETDDDIWEFAAIRREPDGQETALHLFVEHDPAKAARLPERFRADLEARYQPERAVPRRVAAAAILTYLRPGEEGAPVHLVGANPAFDAQLIKLMLHEHGYDAPWHYHLINVEDLMIGHLSATGSAVGLPWRSDDLAARIGIQPDESGRHTAMGDTRWVKAIYDRLRTHRAPQMTERQAAAWPEVIAELRRYDVEVPDSLNRYGWMPEWREEVRPGRGHDLAAVYADGEHFAHVNLDVYGGYSMAVASLTVIHNSSDEDCDCDPCEDQRKADEEGNQ